MPRDQDRLADSRRRRRLARGRQEPITWEVVDPKALHALIHAVTSAGGAVRFGLSRDGSALAIGILGDGEPYTEWFRPSDDIESDLAEMTRSWTGEV